MFPLAVTMYFAEVAAVVVAAVSDVANVADVDAVADVVVVADAVDVVVVVVLSSGEFGFEMSPLTTVGISPLTTVGISPLVMMAASDAEIDFKVLKSELQRIVNLIVYNVNWRIFLLIGLLPE